MDRHRTRQDAFTAEDACQNQAMILNLIRHCGACSEDRPILEVLVNRAIQMEEKNPDDSLTLYREALTLGRNHHPDQAPHCAITYARGMRNLAWVLWNRLSSKEVILYYEKTLNLLESCLFTHVVPAKETLDFMNHRPFPSGHAPDRRSPGSG